MHVTKEVFRPGEIRRIHVTPDTVHVYLDHETKVYRLIPQESAQASRILNRGEEHND